MAHLLINFKPGTHLVIRATLEKTTKTLDTVGFKWRATNSSASVFINRNHVFWTHYVTGVDQLDLASVTGLLYLKMAGINQNQRILMSLLTVCCFTIHAYIVAVYSDKYQWEKKKSSQFLSIY